MNNLFMTLNQRVDQLFWNPVAFNMRVNLILVVTVIAERIKNLSQCQVWKAIGDIFWETPQAPYFNNCAYRCACSFDNRFTAQNLLIFHDITVFS